MSPYAPGQRWISEPEPELGLGTVVETGDGRVRLEFPASSEQRVYAQDQAPLKRVRLKPGASLTTRSGTQLVIESLAEDSGLITYRCDGAQILETDLCDRLGFSAPEERLLSGHFDEAEKFELRDRTLRHQHISRGSAVRGFVGGRIELIPHQLYIAHAVSSRQAPRVLLSDEVGLGKTIEACLILHRLWLSGRASRVLILVPDSLVHQWFVELLRKFHLWFHIFDEERCASIEATQPGTNPFLDDQLILSSLSFLANSPQRAQQAVAAGWDLLVIDEAHHLGWSPEQSTPEYQLAEQLGARAEGLLLLTATPEQLGAEGHFARLRLLDPDRYQDYESFQHEDETFAATAVLAEKLRAGTRLTARDARTLQQWFKTGPAELDTRLAATANGDSGARRELLADLLDLHGPGRVMFRNTRAAMPGFPKRVLNLAPVMARAEHDVWVDRVSTEFAADAGDASLEPDLDLERDPRVEWLAKLLTDLAPEKVLLICRTVDKVIALEHALTLHVKLPATVFHEGLTLVQRDRHAAWFADEAGARLLICSEIGSEGRNFQFAHHLVLFDLPLNPELLEQRIGRLDRIGQRRDIQLHVPYLTGSPQEVLARWYHEGLNAFESSLAGGSELLRQFGRQVHDIALEFPVAEPAAARAELADLITRSRSAREALTARLEQGRDRLLELNSYRPDEAAALVQAIRAADADDTLENYLLDVFEHFGVQVEPLAPRTFHLDARGATTDAFPAIPPEGVVATFDRERAVSREDVVFLSWDHPTVTGAMDLVLGSEKGNCTYAHWPADDRILLLETLFVLETIAPPGLHVDRFLPATPLRVVVNHKPTDVTAAHPAPQLAARLCPGPPPKLLDHPDIQQRVLPQMLAAAEQTAGASANTLIQSSHERMTHAMQRELGRLRHLQQVNQNIRPAEIQLAEHQHAELTQAIRQARVRLDAVRLIWKGPAGM